VTPLSATRWTLVQAAQTGDEAALRALCEKYRPAVVAYLERRGLAGEAEDVAQEVLLALSGSALRAARAAAGRFRALVFGVARNKLLKHLERRGAAKRGAGRVGSLGDSDPTAPDEPDDTFDREWLANLVRAALARLGAEHPASFTALRRFVLDGVPQAEIARELGVTVESVKKLVYRGKRKVAAYLREEVWTYAASSGEYESELAFLSGLLGDDVSA
jgi:RNA polymerase sigma-70 factor (ECF subfamily)